MMIISNVIMSSIDKWIKELCKDAADMIRPVPVPFNEDFMLVPKGWNKNQSLSARVKRREHVKRKNNSNGKS